MWEPDSKQESGKECLRRIFYFVKSSEMKKVLEEDGTRIKMGPRRFELRTARLSVECSKPG